LKLSYIFGQMHASCYVVDAMCANVHCRWWDFTY